MVDLNKVGLVAGRGIYPHLFCEAARARGVEQLSIVAVRGDADAELTDFADDIDWVYAGQLNKTIRALQRAGVDKVVFAGQIKPGRLFKGLRPDVRTVKLLARLKARNAETIFSAMAAEFEADGITVLPATTFLEDALASEGVLGKRKPSAAQLSDIKLGRHIATETSRLDIGQTVVVKNGTVLAVEAFEGTDKAIHRGGELGHGSVVVVKVAKPNQDMRFDVPVVGMRTVDTLRAAGAAVLAVQAGKTLLLEKEKVITALDKAGTVLFGSSGVHEDK